MMDSICVITSLSQRITRAAMFKQVAVASRNEKGSEINHSPLSLPSAYYLSKSIGFVIFSSVVSSLTK
jgi:hypothetical protein